MPASQGSVMATFPIFVFQKAKDLMVNETPENTPAIHTR